jgi:heterodisulfide reductase subunit D
MSNHDSDPLVSAERAEELSHALDTCARCGFCKPECPTHPFGGGFEAASPRAKVHFLKEQREGAAQLTDAWADRLFQCTSCERCVEVCQTDIPLVEVWEEARATLVRLGRGPMPAHKKMRESAEAKNNPYNEPSAERGRWMQPHHQPIEGAELLVFAGCTAAYRMPPMLQTGVTILQLQGIPYAYAGPAEVCCASPFIRTGQTEIADQLMASNVELVARLGVKRIVTACSGCAKTLKKDYPAWAAAHGKAWDVEIVHFAEVYARLLKEGRLRFAKRIEKKVTYHDPCHLGRSQRIFDEPRAILGAIPGLQLIEMPRTREQSRCCGAGGGVKAGFPDMAAEIARARVQEAIETGAEVLVTMCPFCQTSFTQAIKELGADIQLAGVEELLLQSLGTGAA